MSLIKENLSNKLENPLDKYQKKCGEASLNEYILGGTADELLR